ncbi:MAG: MFS transporter [Microscillaceae bacterium]|nr:MFS transporter [Microscillaceae bacterium]
MKRHQLNIIYVTIVIDLIIAFSIIPIYPNFVKNTAFPAVWLSLVSMVFVGIQLISAPLLGKLSDKLGRKPIFQLSLLGTFFSYLFLLPMQAFSLLINRLADGFTNGMAAAINASIADISDDEMLFKRLGYLESLVAIAMILGPALTGLLTLVIRDEALLNQALIYLVLGLALFNFGLSFLFQETHPSQPQTTWWQACQNLRWRDIFPEYGKIRTGGRVLQYLIAMKILLTLSLGYYNYFVIYLSNSDLQMDAQGISYFFLYIGLVYVGISFVYFTFLVPLINKQWLVVITAFLWALTHLLYAQTGSSHFWMYAIVTVDCLVASPLVSTLDGLIAQQTTEEGRGELMGILESLNGLAGFVTTVVFGGLAFIHIALPFYWFALCVFGVGVLAYRLYFVEKIGY